MSKYWLLILIRPSTDSEYEYQFLHVLTKLFLSYSMTMEDGTISEPPPGSFRHRRMRTEMIPVNGNNRLTSYYLDPADAHFTHF